MTEPKLSHIRQSEQLHTRHLCNINRTLMQYKQNTLQYKQNTLQYKQNTLQYKQNTLQYKQKTLQYKQNTLQPNLLKLSKLGCITFKHLLNDMALFCF